MDWYPHESIEKKWQDRWEGEGAHRAEDFSAKEKAYVLVEFPYPSGDGLHVGHVRSYTAFDALARKKRLEGKNVLYPMGWDAFGLPTENYAIKTGVHPRVVTEKNIATFKRQLKALGMSFDWSREVNTTDPAYYRWTQWIFLQLHKRGLAYQDTIAINWCPKDKIGLANEEVVGGTCERCGTGVVRKQQKQWMLKITAYAERLLADLAKVDYLEKIKTQQVNWIGKSEGAEVVFRLASASTKVLLATNNPAKVRRVRMLLAHAAPTIRVVTPKEEGLDVIETEEGDDLTENAINKAKAYAAKTKLPILGMDMGFFIDGVIKDPAKVKRNALGGADEKKLTADEIGEKLFTYYQKMAADQGGEVPGYFLDVFAVVHPDGSIHTSESRRDLLLTDNKVGEVDPHFPIRSLYKVVATGKYVAEQTKEEEIEIELAPYTRALMTLLQPSITVFTTRPDTLFGATYLVLAPEHPLVQGITTDKHKKAVEKYLKQVARKSDLERTDLSKNKTGVFTGAFAINPVNQEEVPIWIADYVLASYGTGAIMAVPAHDERDFEFAKKHKLNIREVIEPIIVHSATEAHPEIVASNSAFTGEGKLINSGHYNGLSTFGPKGARKIIIQELEKKGIGRSMVQYKLRDWVFSRQHYWGEPIPIVHCPKDGVVALPEDQLPLELPHVEKYLPTDTGESPLAAMADWVNTTCPTCGGPAKRETDTMPNWAGSSWYFLRYCDPKNTTAFADKKKLEYWMPVDVYNGGMEHTVLHLLYSRFWNKFLFDEGLVPTAEPYMHRHSHGLVLAEDNQKMSKSRGNVINPDAILKEYGADSLRVYELFMGPFEDTIPWSTRGIIGAHRFLQNVHDLFEPEGSRTWKSAELEIQVSELERWQHKATKKVGEDLEAFHFNTAVSTLMEFTNVLRKASVVPDEAKKTLLLLLFPMAPHLAAELWERAFDGDISKEVWPGYDAAKLVEATIQIVVQVNGRVRAKLSLPNTATQKEAEATALADENVKRFVPGAPKKIIYVAGKLLNIVV